jgi:NAD(P)-dependent dehydrogenase (short-subunit alcohol dehydrogenase family)
MRHRQDQVPYAAFGVASIPVCATIYHDQAYLLSNVCLYRRQAAIHKEKTIMTLESASSGGRVTDALSGRPKVAIVTGASSGIGLEMVKRLIEKGYRVVANSRNITSAMTLEATGDLKLVDGDIGLPETAQRVVAVAMRDFGRIDLLANNAGVFIPRPFTEYLPEDFRRATQTNLAGFFYVSQLAVAQMRLQKFGHVVNISTSLVSQPIAGVPGSLANLTKAGLESVTRALAIEFAAEGIRFNAIAPGVVNTPMNPVEAHEFLRQLSPLKRLAEVGEVADLLLYLESAQFVNGEVVHLDGGAHAGKW